MAFNGISGISYQRYILPIGLMLTAFTIVITFVRASRKGIDVTARKFSVSIIAFCVIVYFTIPFLFVDMPIMLKVIVIIVAIGVAIGNYISIGKLQSYLKNIFYRGK